MRWRAVCAGNRNCWIIKTQLSQMSYLQKGHVYKHQGPCEDLVRSGSWAAVNWECWTQWQSWRGQTGLRCCPPVPTTPYGSTAPSLPGSAPWCIKYFTLLPRLSHSFVYFTIGAMQRRYLQTGLGAGPKPEGLQSGNEEWQSSERTAGLHSTLSPSSSVHQLWTRYSCMSSGSERDELKKTSKSSRRMVRHTSPRYALQ